MKSALEVLKEARQLISKPSAWCRGASARDDFGNPCVPWHPNARRWCAVGALRRAHTGLSVPGGIPIPGAAYLQSFVPEGMTRYASLTVFNDHPLRTHDEVLAVFDAAIAKLEAEK